MFFGLHSTKKVERDLVMAKEPELISVRPEDIHRHPRHKSIVWEEDSGKYYEHDIEPFFKVLKSIDNGTFDPLDNPYILRWGYKGEEPRNRMKRLPELYSNIKENGILVPISVGATGERFDGSFRTKIALYLGIKHVPANLFRFHWSEIDANWIERKINTHWFSTGKEYYEFDYGYAGWKNVYEGGPVYHENAAPRWQVIKDLIKGRVLDLACNEGYMTIQCALAGHDAVGYDIDCIHGANLNKIIFEWIHQEDLPVSFEEKDIVDADPTGFDTVLLLNAIYHLPRLAQVPLLKRMKGKNLILQCNLRKEHERENYFGSHPDDLKELLRKAGLSVVAEIPFRDKPIIVAT